MRVRRLTDEGLERMRVFLGESAMEPPAAHPRESLTDASTSEPIAVEIDVDAQARFARRFEAAEHLYRKLEPLRSAANSHLELDEGLWAWLALLWFDQLCPPDAAGRRRPGEQARWIPAMQNARRYYRHLLLGPYLIYRTHAEFGRLVEPILCDPIHVSTSEHFRTVVETQQFVTSRAVIGAIGRLYYDPQRGRLFRGAGIKGAGGIRRLGDVLSQLDRTFDLHSLDVDSMLALLPEEFLQVSRRARSA